MNEKNKQNIESVDTPPNADRALELLWEVRNIQKDAQSKGSAIDGDDTIALSSKRTTKVGEPESEEDEEPVNIELLDTAFPKTLSRFQIEKQIGSGGFSKVFLAYDPKLQRKVALKVPSLATIATDEYRARFEREARAAGVLSHPSIVPVYESGNIGPLAYIAYQYCEGQTLAEWFESRSRSVTMNEAAEIVEKLAYAVQHAHQRGIIHRDLKPANILVGIPDSNGKLDLRITDFGLARYDQAADQFQTAEGAVVGTPAYMSPEQANSRPEIGLATDVWSLGVILFELITGKLPFEREELLSTIRAIVDDPVPRASSIQRNVPAGLDAVVDLCLRKDPSARYESAFSLAEDLRRWQNHEPVKARPLSQLAKLGMWSQRNPALAVVGSLAFLFLALGLAGTSWQYFLANKNLKLARSAIQEEQKARVKAESVASLFTKTYSRSRPGQDGRQLKVVDMLETTAEEIEAELTDDPHTKWELLNELALTYDGLGVYKPAVALLRQIAKERSDSDEDPSEQQLLTLIALQRSLESLGEYEESSAFTAKAVELAKLLGVQGELLAKVWESQGRALEHAGKHQEASVFAKKAISAYEQDDDCELAYSLSARTLLATCQRMLGEFDDAVDWLEKIVPQVVDQYGNEQPVVIRLLQEYASILQALDRHQDAIEITEQQVTIAQEVLGAKHPRTLQLTGNLASAYTSVGQREKAIKMYRQVIAASEETHGSGSPHVAVPRFILGKQLIKVGEFEEAETQLQQAYEVLKSTAGIDNRWTDNAHKALTSLWFRNEDWGKAVECFESRAIAYEKLGTLKGTCFAALARIEIGQAMIRSGQIEAGLNIIKDNLDLLSDKNQPALVIRSHSSIIDALMYGQALEQAVPFAEEYVKRTPLDYDNSADVCFSRIQSAALHVSDAASRSIELLDELDIALFSRLDSEQKLLLSNSLKLLDENSATEGSPLYSRKELILEMLGQIENRSEK